VNDTFSFSAVHDIDTLGRVSAISRLPGIVCASDYSLFIVVFVLLASFRVDS